MNWQDRVNKIYYESEADKRSSNIKIFISQLLKEQRENCASAVNVFLTTDKYKYLENLGSVILNAPEPGEENQK